MIAVGQCRHRRRSRIEALRYRGADPDHRKGRRRRHHIRGRSGGKGRRRPGRRHAGASRGSDGGAARLTFRLFLCDAIPRGKRYALSRENRFALFLELLSAPLDRALEFRWRSSIDLPECRTEMAVAGEAEVHAERRQIVLAAKQVQRPRQPQAQMVAIERHRLDLLEHLRQINRRYPDFGGDLGQRPAPRQIRGQHELGAVDQLLPAGAGAGGCEVRSPRERRTSVSARVSASSVSAMLRLRLWRSTATSAWARGSMRRRWRRNANALPGASAPSASIPAVVPPR